MIKIIFNRHKSRHHSFLSTWAVSCPFKLKPYPVFFFSSLWVTYLPRYQNKSQALGRAVWRSAVDLHHSSAVRPRLSYGEPLQSEQTLAARRMNSPLSVEAKGKAECIRCRLSLWSVHHISTADSTDCTAATGVSHKMHSHSQTSTAVFHRVRACC